MSAYAFVETDVDKKIEVRLPEGIIAGNLLTRFFSAISLYCMNSIPEKVHFESWFSPHIKAFPDLCILNTAYYGGEWNYKDDEYEKFLSNSSQMQLTKEEFSRTIEQVKENWTEIDAIIAPIVRLNELFLDVQFTETWWFIPEESEKELSALELALKEAKVAGAAKARIQFL
jgi:hypothetical protein